MSELETTAGARLVHFLPLAHIYQTLPTCPNHRLEASPRVLLPATQVEATAGMLQHNNFPVALTSVAGMRQILESTTNLVTGLIPGDTAQHTHVSVDDCSASDVMPVLTPKLHPPMHDVEQVSLPSAADKCRQSSGTQALRDGTQTLPAGENSTMCSFHLLDRCRVHVYLHINNTLLCPPPLLCYLRPEQCKEG